MVSEAPTRELPTGAQSSAIIDDMIEVAHRV